MRLSWVIQVVHKDSYICFYKTEADGELTTQTQTRRNPHDQRERLERFSYKPTHAGSFQRLKEEWVSNLLCPAKNYWFTIHLQRFFPQSAYILVDSITALTVTQMKNWNHSFLYLTLY